MEEKQSEYDFLNFSKDMFIKKNITRDEEIQLSDNIIKIKKLVGNKIIIYSSQIKQCII